MSEPNSLREALIAEMMGDLFRILERLEALPRLTDNVEEKLNQTVKALETAGESYNQAVMAANLRSKNEMLAYLETLSASITTKTKEEQTELVQGLIRHAVSNEIIALKKAVAETNNSYKKPFWRSTFVMCYLTAIVSSVITTTVLEHLGFHQ
jgi:hypothetical protein